MFLRSIRRLRGSSASYVSYSYYYYDVSASHYYGFSSYCGLLLCILSIMTRIIKLVLISMLWLHRRSLRIIVIRIVCFLLVLFV